MAPPLLQVLPTCVPVRGDAANAETPPLCSFRLREYLLGTYVQITKMPASSDSPRQLFTDFPVLRPTIMVRVLLVRTSEHHGAPRRTTTHNGIVAVDTVALAGHGGKKGLLARLHGRDQKVYHEQPRRTRTSKTAQTVQHLRPGTTWRNHSGSNVPEHKHGQVDGRSRFRPSLSMPLDRCHDKWSIWLNLSSSLSNAVPNKFICIATPTKVSMSLARLALFRRPNRVYMHTLSQTAKKTFQRLAVYALWIILRSIVLFLFALSFLLLSLSLGLFLCSLLKPRLDAAF